MFRHRTFFAPLLLIIVIVALSACAAPAEDSQAVISSAVEATLTAVVADNVSATAIPTDDSPATVEASGAEKTPGAQAAVSTNAVLPPLVADFDPAPRPASSKGDPNAPVVIYEWSDYT